MFQKTTFAKMLVIENNHHLSKDQYYVNCRRLNSTTNLVIINYYDLINIGYNRIKIIKIDGYVKLFSFARFF